MAWYLPIALKPLGRGLDHDLFDPAKLKLAAKEAPNWVTADPAWRTGVVLLDAKYAKGGRILTANDDADALLSLFPQRYLMVDGAPRYLRQFLPTGLDIAFTWRLGPDRQGSYNELRSSRELCVSRRVMQALVDAKLVGEKEFKPIEILESLPKGAKMLDKPGETGPGPLFEGEWRKRIDAAEKKRSAGAKGESKPAAPRAPGMVLRRLKSAQKKDARRFPAGAAPGEAGPLDLPLNWRQALQVSNGFEIAETEALDGAAASFDSTGEFKRNQKKMLALYTELTGEKPDGLAYIGNTIWGDLFFLRPRVGADAPAFLLSHETGQEMANWPTSMAMLDELLAS
jgi:hypothetical protein